MYVPIICFLSMYVYCIRNCEIRFMLTEKRLYNNYLEIQRKSSVFSRKSITIFREFRTKFKNCTYILIRKSNHQTLSINTRIVNAEHINIL